MFVGKQRCGRSEREKWFRLPAFSNNHLGLTGTAANKCWGEQGAREAAGGADSSGFITRLSWSFINWSGFEQQTRLCSTSVRKAQGISVSSAALLL